MSRPLSKEQVTCERCGILCRSSCKKRAICRRCWRKEERIQCVRCGRKINQTSQEIRDLCIHCRKQDQQKQKVACSVCGKLRISVLITRAICASCWRAEQNDQGICTRCQKQKMIFNKALRCCRSCYQELYAEADLQRYVEQFTALSAYRQRLFHLLVSTFSHEKITRKHTQQARTFGRFLQETKVPEPLTWEFIEETVCTAKSRTAFQKFVRTSLLTLGHLLASRGELETREAFLAKRAALRPLESIRQEKPETAQLLQEYTTWLWQRKTAPQTVNHHLMALVHFWSWCDTKGIYQPSEVSTQIVNEYLHSLAFQFRCVTCQATVAFDPKRCSMPRQCPVCKAIGTLVKERSRTPHTISLWQGMISVFFTWAKLNRMIIANPVSPGRPTFQKRIRHYPIELVRQLSQYIISDQADPTEAFLLYLVLFEGLSRQELCHAQLPTIHALRPGIATPTLAESYAILLPRRSGTRGRRSPERPTTRLDFPVQAAPFLKPLLARFEQQRSEVVKNPKNHYVFVSAGVAGMRRHPGSVSGDFILWGGKDNKRTNISRHHANSLIQHVASQPVQSCSFPRREKN